MDSGIFELPNERVSAANGVDYAYRDTGGRRGGAAGPASALPREPGQLGPGADRRAGVGPAGRDVRQRRSRRLHRHHPGHHRADGPRCHRVPGRHGDQPGRPARLLHRQLRRAADRADPAGHRPQAGPGLLGAAGRGRHARLGARGHRRDRHAANQPGGVPGRVLRPVRRQPAGGQQALRRMYARTEDRDKATTWATREAQYDAVCTWGIPDHALLQRLSCHRACRCSWPTATATR